MIIGDKKTIGVELEVLRSANSNYEFAKCFFWIFGDCIGNPDEVSHRGLMGSSFADLSQRLSSQRVVDIQAIFNCDTEEVFQSFESQLWAGNGDMNRNKYQVPDALNYFSLPVGVELFDGEKVYLLQGLDMDRVIWKKWDEKIFKSEYLPKGYFHSVIKNVISSL